MKSRPLFAPYRKRRIYFFIYLFLFLLVLTMVFILNLINNARVKIVKQSITIAGLPAELENIKVLHISDLNAQAFGEEQINFQAQIKNENYDFVCMTGDMVGKSGNYQPFLDLIALFKNKPVFFIAGDSDPSPIYTDAHGSNEVLAEFITAAETMGAVYLDSPQSLTFSGATLWVCPESVLGMDIEVNRNAYLSRRGTLSAGELIDENTAAAIRAIDYQLSVLDETEAALAAMRKDGIRIALTHCPMTVQTIRTLQQWAGTDSEEFLRGVSLLLAGHYNNGQARLPFLGAVYVPSLGFFPKNNEISGLSTVQGVSQYISPGLGVSDFYPSLPIRLFNTPIATILTLTSKIY